MYISLNRFAATDSSDLFATKLAHQRIDVQPAATTATVFSTNFGLSSALRALYGYMRKTRSNGADVNKSNVDV